jgi:hypothetical protein
MAIGERPLQELATRCQFPHRNSGEFRDSAVARVFAAKIGLDVPGRCW